MSRVRILGWECGEQEEEKEIRVKGVCGDKEHDVFGDGIREGSLGLGQRELNGEAEKMMNKNKEGFEERNLVRPIQASRVLDMGRDREELGTETSRKGMSTTMVMATVAKGNGEESGGDGGERGKRRRR
ncbi:hypothetical protein Droror1_Dr00010321 [Drosera rotundifolia]